MKIIVIFAFLLVFVIFSVAVNAQLKISPTTTAFNFSISSSSSSGTIVDVGSVELTLKAVLVSGTAQSVSFSCSNLPAGTACSFTPTSCTPSCSTAAKISASSSTTAGSYKILLVATDGKIRNYITFLLTVKKSSLATPTSSPITRTQSPSPALTPLPSLISSPKLTSTPLLSPTTTPLTKTPSPSPTSSPISTATPSPKQTIGSSPTPKETTQISQYVLTITKDLLKQFDQDKKYWLERIRNYNAIGKKLEERMRELNNKLNSLTENYRTEVEVDNQLRFELDGVKDLAVADRKGKYKLVVSFEEAFTKAVGTDTKSVSKIKLKIENKEPIYIIDSVKIDGAKIQTKINGKTGEVLKADATLNLPTTCQDYVIEPEFDEDQIEAVNIYMPYYLDPNSPSRLESDCDVLKKDEEIKQDLDSKLDQLETVESEIDSDLAEANSLHDRGKNALGCIRSMEDYPLVESGQSTQKGIYPSTGGSYFSLGSSYTGAGEGEVLINDLENFHSAYIAAYQGRNYVKGDLETLRSLVEGLEAYCQKADCMFGEQKKYYQDLLDATMEELEHYAEEAKRVIEDARKFAEHYKNYNRDWVGQDISGENKCASPYLDPLVNVQDFGLGVKINLTNTLVTDISKGRLVSIKVGNKIGIVEGQGKNKLVIKVKGDVIVLDEKNKVRGFSTENIQKLAKMDNIELSPTAGNLEKKFEELEEKLNTIGEDQQLAQIDLQNKLQQSQQLIQMMSNISKMMYDTTMAIIRKIGG